jgi:hypothetical protein
MYVASHALKQIETEELSKGCVVEFADEQRWPGQLTVKKGHPLTIMGWAADTERGLTPSRLEILFVDGDRNESVVGSGTMTIERSDVVATFHRPGLLKSGFSIVANTSTVGTGRQEIRIREYFKDKSEVCYSDKMVRIED